MGARVQHTPSEAEQRFASRGVRRGNALFFDAEAAADVISECKMDSIPILGIDGVTFGFQDSKEVLYASTADIVDFRSSTVPLTGNVYDLSLAFISDPKRRGMHFDIVFGD